MGELARARLAQYDGERDHHRAVATHNHAAHLVVEASLVLVQLAVPHGRALADGGNAPESVLGTTEETHNETLITVDLDARGGGDPVLGVLPLAVGPDRALDRAALGHLNAVERVAVGAEETGNEVVAAAELAAAGVELLPPVLVVAA